MTYYNCHNTEGFQVDGNMTQPEMNYNDTFCHWEVMQGEVGTYLRTIELHQNYFDWTHKVDYDPVNFLRHWWYDNNDYNRMSHGDDPLERVPVYENGMHLCSYRLNNDVRCLISTLKS